MTKPKLNKAQKKRLEGFKTAYMDKKVVKKLNYEKNCMSYWLPKLFEMKVPIPKTIMVDMNKVDKNFVGAIRKIFWMKKPNKEDRIALTKFRHVLERMGHKIGYPLFLRTGQTSEKHEWSETCFIKSQDKLLKNAQNIAEYSIMKDMKGGFPINIWVARELLKTAPAFTAFGGMPIAREFRYFVEDGKILCRHPYWPQEAFKGLGTDKDWKLKLAAMNKLKSDEREKLDILAEKIARKFEGAWSIDFLQNDKLQWYIIDMATKADSYHWKGCPNRPKEVTK